MPPRENRDDVDQISYRPIFTGRCYQGITSFCESRDDVDQIPYRPIFPRRYHPSTVSSDLRGWCHPSSVCHPIKIETTPIGYNVVPWGSKRCRPSTTHVCESWDITEYNTVAQCHGTYGWPPNGRIKTCCGVANGGLWIDFSIPF